LWSAVICPLFLLLLTAQALYGAPDLVLRDLWDTPLTLPAICAGQKTLILVCDLKISTCREAAIHFQARTPQIKDTGIRPALILIGDPAVVRDAVLALDLELPVYIDANRRVFGDLLTQEVLPALVLLDEAGLATEILYGGGDSLDSNIRTLIRAEDGAGRRWWLLLIPVAVLAAILPLVID
jgi:hypothetical protein